MDSLTTWLVNTIPPPRVLSAAYEHIYVIQRSDWLHLLGHREYSMVPRLVSALATSCLTLDTFTDHASLAHLCILCLLHTPSVRSRPPAGFVFFARPVLRALLSALEHVDLASTDSASLLKDVLEIQRSVEEDILWKDGKTEVVAGFDRLLSFVSSTERKASDSESQGLGRISRPEARFSPSSVSNGSSISTSRRPLSPGGAVYEAAEAGEYGTHIS
ncbi:hypothetical protein B0H15DRAFT_852398 [Mycena belliarum]|uniref:Uncharacterized protein n=1 Tax=Mycena belliarum TaxID=1033014 RepID=A0AAD6TXG5_9AGAR|nr:hypothetical protein B0H15DRAFT_852398 [Mycena belliae]